MKRASDDPGPSEPAYWSVKVEASQEAAGDVALARQARMLHPHTWTQNLVFKAQNLVFKAQSPLRHTLSVFVYYRFNWLFP
jgi:4'-phosphopantetheinyl transferase EntD